MIDTMKKYKIVIVGSGNVASHFGRALKIAGQEIIQVYSRNPKTAKTLADELKAESIGNFNLLSLKADVYLLAVTDDAIANLPFENKLKDKTVIHTSGMQPLEILKNHSKNCGVLYPLQTFTKHVFPDLKQVPLLVESSNAISKKAVSFLASLLSENVHELITKKRQAIHLAAVFSNNFTNHLFTIARDILQHEELELELLFPLFDETIRKIKTKTPAKLQTGPAIRGDENTMRLHLELLETNPTFQEVYKKISKSIKEYHGI